MKISQNIFLRETKTYLDNNLVRLKNMDKYMEQWDKYMVKLTTE